ncbi:MAG: nitroreductase family protein [Candidatus Marinimicrobia bacterium]|nr:nitroreductase family protein [Candidatus Neomarinimicrobiota bacterium]
MEFRELIKLRESVRNYDLKKPVPRDVLDRILEAGRLAPSAANRQPWKFLVVSSREMLEKVHDCYAKDWFRAAPVILIVVGKREDAWTRRYDGYNSLETDLTIAMDHLILAAANEGVGSCWIAAFEPNILRHALELNDAETVFAITPLGYPEDSYQPGHAKNRKEISEIVEYL